MKYTVGFIGIGKMGGALLESVCKSISGDKVAAFDVDTQYGKQKTKDLGAVFTSLEDVARNSKYIFLGVKPNIIGNVLGDIKQYISDQTVLVSMAAGVSTDDIVLYTNLNKIIRIMPNTPVSACEGLVLYTYTGGVLQQEIDDFLGILKFAGMCDHIDEKFIDAAAALSGCGPAFVYMFIEGLADGAVKCGLSRDKALAYAKQTVLGSAAYALKTDKHPENLKDDVCSPGGTTIEGVLALEKGSFRHTAASAVVAAFEKTKLLK